MTVWLGAYVGDNSTVNAQQQEFILDALRIYGTDHVGGVTIGNECVRLVRSKAFSPLLNNDAEFNLRADTS